MSTGWKAQLEPLVRGMAEAVLSEELGTEDPGQIRFLDEVTEGLLFKLENMPRYLGVGMIALTTAFDAGGVGFSGRPLHLAPMAARKRQIRLWKRIPVGLLAQYTAFYEKMSLFIYYCHLEESDPSLHATEPA